MKMNKTDQIRLCQNIWNKINNPHSAVPDISICDVFRIMIDELSKLNVLAKDDVQNWALNALSVSERDTSKMDLCLIWQDKVPRYYGDGRKDEHGYPLAIPFEEYEKLCLKYYNQMSDAIDALVGQGKVVETFVDDMNVGIKLNKEEE